MSKVHDVLVKHGIVSTEAVADDSALVDDFLAMYAQFKANPTMTNAQIGAEVKKAFNRQDKREERKAARIAARKAAMQ